MRRKEFLLLLDEFFEKPEGTVKGNEALDDFEWDSIKVLMFAALVDERLGKVVDAEPLAECRTVADLLNLVQDKLDG